MIATTARTGGAMGVALSATLFGYLLSAAGLSSGQIGSPESWRAAPAIFMSSFSTTIYVLNFFTVLAIFSSAMRGKTTGTIEIVRSSALSAATLNRAVLLDTKPDPH